MGQRLNRFLFDASGRTKKWTAHASLLTKFWFKRELSVFLVWVVSKDRGKKMFRSSEVRTFYTLKHRGVLMTHNDAPAIPRFEFKGIIIVEN